MSEVVHKFFLQKYPKAASQIFWHIFWIVFQNTRTLRSRFEKRQ